MSLDALSATMLASLVQFPMVAVERGLNRVAFVDDLPKRPRQRSIELRPIAYLGPWLGLR